MLRRDYIFEAIPFCHDYLTKLAEVGKPKNVGLLPLEPRILEGGGFTTFSELKDFGGEF